MLNPEKIIVALDFPNKMEMQQFIQKMNGKLRYVKVGMELYYSEGPSIIQSLKDQGLKVFLDLKLHDIPTTVARAMAVLANLQIDMVNMHCLGGSAMIKAACEVLGPDILKIGVTQLTSSDQNMIETELSIKLNMQQSVLSLAQLVNDNGGNGVVCSPLEVQSLKERFGPSFLTVTPGVRPSWDQKNDHARSCTPAQAFENGSDYIVIGRTLTRAEDPITNFQRILEEI